MEIILKPKEIIEMWILNETTNQTSWPLVCKETIPTE
jgi:hypothetical protein